MVLKAKQNKQKKGDIIIIFIILVDIGIIIGMICYKKFKRDKEIEEIFSNKNFFYVNNLKCVKNGIIHHEVHFAHTQWIFDKLLEMFENNIRNEIVTVQSTDIPLKFEGEYHFINSLPECCIIKNKRELNNKYEVPYYLRKCVKITHKDYCNDFGYLICFDDYDINYCDRNLRDININIYTYSTKYEISEEIINAYEPIRMIINNAYTNLCILSFKIDQEMKEELKQY